MNKAKIGKAVRALGKMPRASLLGRRTKRLWPRVETDYRTAYSIPSIASPKTYRKFIANFKPKKVGEFKTHLRKASHEAHLMIALTGLAGKNIGSILKKEKIIFGKKFKVPQNISETKIKVPSNLFRMKFALTSTIEPGVPHPIDRKSPAAVCAVMGWQGPSQKKYAGHLEHVKHAKKVLGEPWQNFLLKEIIRHAKSEGMQAVALLRPDYNPNLTKEHFVKENADTRNLPGIRSQFFAAARKAGMKKVKGSKYFWIFFPKNKA